MARDDPRWLLRSEPGPRYAGALAAGAAVVASTVVVYPLKQVAPVVSLGVVYMLAVFVVAAAWGSLLGALTAVASAAAFSFFYLPPVGRLTIRDSQNWIALAAFLIAAALASSVADVARARDREAAERRGEADLAAEMAGLLLRGARLEDALPNVAARLAQALGLPSAAIELSDVGGDARMVALPLGEGPQRVGTLLLGRSTPEPTLRRIAERVAPALEALLSAAQERERLQAQVVETAALRRADVFKTGLLRAVSHDLRSPLPAILAAAGSVAAPGVSVPERERLAGALQEESRDLWHLVENLLDLSRLDAGVAASRREWISLDEIIRVALGELGAGRAEYELSIDAGLPLIHADAVQLQRAFVNVLGNARRHSGAQPIVVRTRLDADRVLVTVTDRGPGITPAQLESVFEPFHRGSAASDDYRGSGLGLAVARGFTESSGGTLHVESPPGSGATFVFAFPLDAAVGARALIDSP